MIEVYTDGSCLVNPGGPGGWAVLIKENDKQNREYVLSGGEPSTTNNRMELTAVIEARSCIMENTECNIYSDSQLTINCATGKWKRKANLDLWEEYDKKAKNVNISYTWVKAHSGDKYNEIVDKIALGESRQQQAILNATNTAKIFKKTINYEKNVTKTRCKLEVELQKKSSNHSFSPKILKSVFENDKCIIEMEDLEELSLADKYGDDPENIPNFIWAEIRRILYALYIKEEIEYIDITPYNFIEKDNMVYIIDFGHAYYTKTDEINWFLHDFLEGHNGWNPDFK